MHPDSCQAVSRSLYGDPTSRSGRAPVLVLVSVSVSLVNLFAVWLEYKFGPQGPYADGLSALASTSLWFFAADFLLKLWLAPHAPEGAAKGRARFLLQPTSLLQLASFLPSLAFGLTTDLRLLRAYLLIWPLRPGSALWHAVGAFRSRHAGESFRYQIYQLLNPSARPDALQRMVELSMLVVIVLAVLGVIGESVESLNGFALEFHLLEVVLTLLFTVEYVMRIYSIPEDPALKGNPLAHLQGAIRPAQIIDLCAILPFYAHLFFPGVLHLQFLRAFRLIRALKLLRFSRASRTLMTVLQAEWPVIGAAIFIMFIFVIVTASVGYLFEHTAQPDKFENIPQSIYWAVITLASVGYGDISPVTEGGRAATIVSALAGIGIFALPAAILSSAFVDQLHQDRERLRDEIRRALEEGPMTETRKALLLEQAEEEGLSLNDSEIEEMILRITDQMQREARQQGHSHRHSGFLDPGHLSAAQALAAYHLHLAWLQSLATFMPPESPGGQHIQDSLQPGQLSHNIWSLLQSTQPSPDRSPHDSGSLGTDPSPPPPTPERQPSP